MTPFTPQQLARQLRDLLPEKRIIFIHPNFNGQHLVLDQVLTDGVYVRLQGQELGEPDLRQQLDTVLQTQTGKTQLDGKVSYVVLDESDRAQPQALIGLLHALLSELDGGRIIVLSRVLTEGVLRDEGIKQQSSFIPADTRVMLWDYAQNSGETLLEVRAFGEGRVHVNGRYVDSWDGALPRALFFYLVDRGMVTRAEIFQTFWSGLSTREATNVFHVTKRKISEVLGTELTLYGSGFYHVSPKIQLSYDVSLFNQLVQDSDSGDDGDSTLRQAISLYRGDYLSSLKSDWVLERRESLQQSVCDAMVSLGRLYENKGDMNEALSYYLRAMHLKPEREDSAYSIMRLYRELNMTDDALQVYRRLAKTLKDKLKVEPSSHIQKLATQLGK
ncbi:MAG: bacterial transcriptional activator domain-containing protein [Chloroflexota bacterium]